MGLQRRSFILAGSASLLDAQRSISDQISLGVIGSGGRGTTVMTVFQKVPSVRVGAICDVYEPNLEKALSLAAKDHPLQGSRMHTQVAGGLCAIQQGVCTRSKDVDTASFGSRWFSQLGHRVSSVVETARPRDSLRARAGVIIQVRLWG